MNPVTIPDTHARSHNRPVVISFNLTSTGFVHFIKIYDSLPFGITCANADTTIDFHFPSNFFLNVPSFLFLEE